MAEDPRYVAKLAFTSNSGSNVAGTVKLEFGGVVSTDCIAIDDTADEVRLNLATS